MPFEDAVDNFVPDPLSVLEWQLSAGGRAAEAAAGPSVGAHCASPCSGRWHGMRCAAVPGHGRHCPGPPKPCTATFY